MATTKHNNEYCKHIMAIRRPFKQNGRSISEGDIHLFRRIEKVLPRGKAFDRLLDLEAKKNA